MNRHDVLRRLALSQARGDRQVSFVNELLSWASVPAKLTYPPGVHNGTLVYGVSRLPSASWKNLKKRLISVGFVISITYPSSTVNFYDAPSVRLTFPELGFL